MLLDPRAGFEGIAPVCAFCTTVSLSQNAYIGSALFFPRDSLGVQVCARSAVCAQGSWWHPSPRGNQPTLPAVVARLPPPPPVARFRNIWWFTCSTHHLPDALQAVAPLAPLESAPQQRHRNPQEYLTNYGSGQESGDVFQLLLNISANVTQWGNCQLICKCLVMKCWDNSWEGLVCAI